MAPAKSSPAAKWAARSVSVLLLCIVASAITVLIVIPRATHGVAMTVLTGSMTPTIPVGSTVIVRPVDPGTLQVGDVVTYQPEPGKPTFITHRIVKIDTSKTPTRYTFKGDANRAADIFPVSAKQIRGRVWFHVPFLGGIRDALHTKGGLSGVAMLLLAGYAVTQLAAALRDRRAGTTSGTDRASTAPINPGSGLALQLLVATFPVDAFDRLLPCEASQLLRVELLAESDDQFTIAVAREPDQLDELTEFLKLFKPISLVRSEIVTVPHCRPAIRPELVVGAHAI